MPRIVAHINHETDPNHRAGFAESNMTSNHAESIHKKWAAAQRIKKLPDEITPKQQERFWKKVDKCGADECWPWIGWHQNGYGSVKLKGVVYRVHRVAFKLANPNDLGDRCICHRCDNSLCCNPNHLFIGTIVDNINDMVQKRRHGFGKTHSSVTRIECRPRGMRNGSNTKPEKRPKGEGHGMHILLEPQIRKIRSLHAAGASRRSLRHMFNTSKSNIAFIVTGKTWKCLL